MNHLVSRRSLHAFTASLLLAVLPMTAAWAQSPAPRVTLETSLGSIVLELDAEKAPVTVDNFLQYVRDGHYDGTIFHRVISNFMIQGGGFTPDMQQKPTRAPIPLESRNGLRNTTGTIAMARTQVPDSATAQFFINVKDNDFLDQANSRDGHGYAVFGRVVSGMDVVEKIRTAPTSRRGMHSDVPLTTVTIYSAHSSDKNRVASNGVKVSVRSDDFANRHEYTAPIIRFGSDTQDNGVVFLARIRDSSGWSQFVVQGIIYYRDDWRRYSSAVFRGGEPANFEVSRRNIVSCRGTPCLLSEVYSIILTSDQISKYTENGNLQIQIRANNSRPFIIEIPAIYFEALNEVALSQ